MHQLMVHSHFRLTSLITNVFFINHFPPLKKINQFLTVIFQKNVNY